MGQSIGPLGLFTVLLGAALPLIDFFIVNVALPSMDSDLAAGPAMLELVVAGYGVAYAVLLVLGGRLGDMAGRRRLFLIGMAAFGLTSLACGLAPTAWTLVGARVAQGAAAALMMPQVLATIQATTQGPRRARAMSLYGATAGLSMVGRADTRRRTGRGRRRRHRLALGVPGERAGRRPRPVPRGPFGPGDPLGAPGQRSTCPARCSSRLSLVSLLLPLTEGRAAGWPLWTWVSLGVVPLRGCRVLPGGAAARTGADGRRWCRRACSNCTRCGAVW